MCTFYDRTFKCSIGNMYSIDFLLLKNSMYNTGDRTF